jgi:hypothetical protein
MKQLIWLVTATLAFATVSYSQEGATRPRTTANPDISTAATQNNKIEIANGTRLTGELQNSLDVRRAKVGDEVILKTNEPLQFEGRMIINKGARLFGRVTGVTPKSKNKNESTLGLVFERIEDGSLNIPIVASVSSVANSHTAARSVDSDDVSTKSKNSSQSNGGLINGVKDKVTSTTGTVVGATTNAVGSAVRETTNVVDDITGSGSSSVGRIQISQPSDASATIGSVLSLHGDNIHLEKGTTLNLRLNQAVSVEKN